MKLAQYFNITLSKYVFFHPDHGFVKSVGGLRADEAADFGFEHTFVYSVGILGLPGPFVAVYRQSEVIRPYNFLSRAWSNWQPELFLSGVPDVLHIHPAVLDAIPDYFGELAQLNLECTRGDTKDKKFTGSARQGDKVAYECDIGIIKETADFNNAVASDCRTRAKLTTYDKSYDLFCEPLRDRLPIPVPSIDVNGTVSRSDELAARFEGAFRSNQSNIPSRSYIDFLVDLETKESLILDADQMFDGAVRLYRSDAMTPKVKSYRASMVATEDVSELRDLIAPIIDVLAVKKSEIARRCGIATKDLSWFISGRQNLDEFEISNLMRELGIHRRGEYELAYFDPQVVFPTSKRSAINAYDAIVPSGNLQFSSELVPSEGKADPDFRYFLFWDHASMPMTRHVMVLERGSIEASLLDNQKGGFLNYKGLEEVDPAYYESIQSYVNAARNNQLSNEEKRKYWIGLADFTNGLGDKWYSNLFGR